MKTQNTAQTSKEIKERINKLNGVIEMFDGIDTTGAYNALMRAKREKQELQGALKNFSKN